MGKFEPESQIKTVDLSCFSNPINWQQVKHVILTRHKLWGHVKTFKKPTCHLHAVEYEDHNTTLPIKRLGLNDQDVVKAGMKLIICRRPLDCAPEVASWDRNFQIANKHTHVEHSDTLRTIRPKGIPKSFLQKVAHMQSTEIPSKQMARMVTVGGEQVIFKPREHQFGHYLLKHKQVEVENEYDNEC